MKKTVLFEKHVGLGAKLAPFAGYTMPIQYAGIRHEHEATRSRAAVFDTCHMGVFNLRGRSVEDDLERLVTCRLADLAPGRCRYGLMCNENGGVIDDLVVYRRGADDFMLVVNAGTKDKDFEWVREHVSDAVVLEDSTDVTAKIDLQGPQAPRIAQELLEQPIEGLVYFSFGDNLFEGSPVLVSRTGYTGEIGFEFYGSPNVVAAIWDRCIELGGEPAGLGARDTLRLESGMPLYGHELSEDRNANQTGFCKSIDLNKNFIGSEYVCRPPENLLCGICISGRRAARSGDRVECEGAVVGEVTSGSFAPSLEVPVALAYVLTEKAVVGADVTVRRGEKEMAGTLVQLPFYKNGTARKKISRFLLPKG
jgi:aminomethyltransferase